MSTLVEAETCHVASCSQLAVYACDRCGKPFCDAHLKEVSLKRRMDPAETSQKAWDLTRVPSYVETYRLCAQCSTKPFAGRALPDPAW
jgi:hypothetical protein